ncbi:MAG TPA: transposase [Gammaproteobacteria bacterium]|nr:transposase [Gammaproteobacteria bacterium]
MLGKTETERAAYCRGHGIYINHLDEWKKQVLESLGVANTKKHKAEYLLILNEVKQLKRDLHRKDKALAEVSALLILKKKADLLWGDSEDV